MKKPLPVYCLVGEDGYRKREFLAEIKGRILSGDGGPLNYEYILASEADAARVLDAARTPAWDLFSAGTPGGKPSRLVVVDGAEVFPPSQWRKLREYFSDPDPETCLVFLVGKPEKDWSAKKYVPGPCLKNFGPLRKDHLRRWIGEEASRRGLRLSREQVEECARTAGNDLGGIAAGLERLALYRGESGTVSDREIRDLVGTGRVGTVFSLTELAAAGKAGEALAILNRLLDEGEEPLRIFALIAGSVRKLWLGVDAWQRTGDESAATAAAGVRYYREKFIRQVRSLSAAEIARWYRRLVETDYALKGGEKNPRLALERLLVDLAVRPRPG